jgi:3-hydroxybutyrate dehydrogenase
MLDSKLEPMTTTAKQLAGKSAIVTGSTSGIGLEIASYFAASGANVMLNGFGDAKEIEKLRGDLAKKHGVKVAYSGADLSKTEPVYKMVEEAEAAFGAVDILVNNAGIQHVEHIENFPIAKYDAIIAINMSSNFHSIRAALPGMKKRGWGRIINVASAHGLVASPYKSAYVTAKHGVLGLTKTVALEAAEFGVTCNAICPGYVRTPLVEGQIDDTAKARGITREQVIKDVLLKAQPTKRFVEPEEVAALAVFLCSKGAASITGSALPIEGGWVAQ